MIITSIKEKTRNRLQASTGSKQFSFLTEPDFTPILPSKNTLTYQALLLMMEGKKISHRDFDDKTDSWRLAAYICELRNKLGWPIEDEETNASSHLSLKSRHIKRYFLRSDIIQKVKKMGVLV